MLMQVDKAERMRGNEKLTLFRSSCLIMVYKNLDISGLLGMVGPLIRFARAAIGSIDAGDGVSGK